MGVMKYVLISIVILTLFLSGCTNIPEDLVCISKSELTDKDKIEEFINTALEEIEAEEGDGELTDLEEEMRKLEEELEKEEQEDETPEESPDETPEDSPRPTQTPMRTPTPSSDIPTREYTEGDLVSIRPQASDADGDTVTFTFTDPLDEDGEWQTEEGDAGEYIVTVTADDGKTQVSRQLRIVISGTNSPPEIDVDTEITVDEGESVEIEPTISDADGDSVQVSYSGWKTVPEFMTGYDDAGEHVITITADDGTSETTEDVTITVLNTNRAPVIEEIDPVSANEGETITIEPEISDPDGDDVEVTFSEPFDEDGEWETEIGDAGNYMVQVRATDGDLETIERVTVVVNSLNKVPVIEVDRSMLVNVGDTVVLEPQVTDADGDDIEIRYSGWMTSNTKVVEEDDAGITHTVTITASDGQAESSVDVRIEVNSPPEWDFGFE
jgi:hypothetical protein